MSDPTRSLRWKIACVNWSHPTAPKAVAYVLRDGVMTFDHFFDTHVEAVAFVDSKLPKKARQ